MRARLALSVSGVAHELREVALKSKPPQLLAVSPKGTVPVLVLPSGQVIDESLGIMRWALEQNDPLDWLQQALAADIEALTTINDGVFKQALDRYKYPYRYPDQHCGDVALFAQTQREVASSWLYTLDERLSEGWLLGSHSGIADMACLPFVRQFAHTDATWFAGQPWPKLQRWLARFEEGSLFASVMVKHELWLTED